MQKEQTKAKKTVRDKEKEINKLKVEITTVKKENVIAVQQKNAEDLKKEM